MVVAHLIAAEARASVTATTLAHRLASKCHSGCAGNLPFRLAGPRIIDLGLQTTPQKQERKIKAGRFICLWFTFSLSVRGCELRSISACVFAGTDLSGRINIGPAPASYLASAGPFFACTTASGLDRAYCRTAPEVSSRDFFCFSFNFEVRNARVC
jgi:hypothetical protein